MDGWSALWMHWASSLNAGRSLDQTVALEGYTAWADMFVYPFLTWDWWQDTHISVVERIFQFASRNDMVLSNGFSLTALGSQGSAGPCWNTSHIFNSSEVLRSHQLLMKHSLEPKSLLKRFYRTLCFSGFSGIPLHLLMIHYTQWHHSFFLPCPPLHPEPKQILIPPKIHYAGEWWYMGQHILVRFY